MYTSYFIIAAVIICSVWALPPELHSPPPAFRKAANEVTIVKSIFEDDGQGKFNWAYENSDGTKAEQRGYLKNAGTENEIQVLEGSYSYISEGQLLTIDYIADENGYRPTGKHLPK